MSKPKIIKKLAVKTVCGTPTAEVIGFDDEKQKDIIGFKTRNLMKIVGITTSLKTGDGIHGTFIALMGQFEATNLETGEIFRSSKCFLPDDVTALVSAQLSPESTNAVEFAFNIGVQPADTATGYEYTAEPLLDTSKNDPLDLLAKRLDSPGNSKPDESNTIQNERKALQNEIDDSIPY